MDTEKTIVIFRYWRDDVIALFPFVVADRHGRCQSYMHIDKHAVADYYHIISPSRPATPAEYAALKAELESIGYALTIRQNAVY